MRSPLSPLDKGGDKGGGIKTVKAGMRSPLSPLNKGGDKGRGIKKVKAIAGRHAGLFTGKRPIGKESAKKLATVFKVDYRVFL
jgi:hypothetical protein